VRRLRPRQLSRHALLWELRPTPECPPGSFPGGPPRIIADEGSYNLSWSPDGSKIVIAASQEGLWLVNADGSGLTQIAQEGKQPSWQAVP